MDEFLDVIAPYNLWHGNTLPIGFNRHSYTERLMRYTGNRLVKVLTGQRRVGKSYIMRQIAVKLIRKGVKAENTLFINRELAVFDFIQNAYDLNRLVDTYRNRFKPEGRIYIFIDEVQEIKDWERTVNSLSQDYTVDVEVFISGSNSRLLSGELASLLSGRYVELAVFPFSFTEFTEVHGLPSDRQSFLRYIHEGGLPELINLPDEEVKQRYMAGLRDSIMLKYIVKRYTIKDVSLLENLFAYLVHKSERYNIAGKELLAGNFKVYVNDQAYHNYLFPTVRFGSGYLLEGIVYIELLRKGHKVNTGIIRGKEVDFIATKNETTLYIQVAYMLTDDTTAGREYASLESVNGIGEKLLVTLDDITYPTRNGIRHVQAWRMGEVI
ncbi:MAG: ATP-binding protein [Duncaniella sp.]|nr:ATP-binding protein [Duncaniella sp.]